MLETCLGSFSFNMELRKYFNKCSISKSSDMDSFFKRHLSEGISESGIEPQITKWQLSSTLRLGQLSLFVLVCFKGSILDVLKYMMVVMVWSKAKFYKKANRSILFQATVLTTRFEDRMLTDHFNFLMRGNEIIICFL